MTRTGYNDLAEEYSLASGKIKKSSSNRTNLYLMGKRISDLIMATLGLFIALPIILIFALAIKIESPGPAFYLQERVGLGGKCFKIIKLRSMVTDAEKNGAQWAEVNDSRVTRIGAFIRKTRIDELPQLINVLQGSMTLVGPRPERPVFTAKFNEEIPGFIKRLDVKPGLTGWAQVNGGYDIPPEEKLQHDLYYIEHQSFWVDMKIIAKTARIVITGEGAR